MWGQQRRDSHGLGFLAGRHCLCCGTAVCASGRVPNSIHAIQPAVQQGGVGMRPTRNPVERGGVGSGRRMRLPRHVVEGGMWWLGWARREGRGGAHILYGREDGQGRNDGVA